MSERHERAVDEWKDYCGERDPREVLKGSLKRAAAYGWAYWGMLWLAGFGCGFAAAGLIFG